MARLVPVQAGTAPLAPLPLALLLVGVLMADDLSCLFSRERASRPDSHLVLVRVLEPELDEERPLDLGEQHAHVISACSRYRCSPPSPSPRVSHPACRCVEVSPLFLRAHVV